MNRLRCALSVGLLGPALFIVSGCWDSPSGSGTISAPIEQSRVSSSYDTDAKSRARYVSDHVAQYIKHAHQLPGSTEFLQRILIEGTFDDLSNILPQLAGAEPGAIFRQQLHIVQATHVQLTLLPLDSSSDPIIEAGLRAASDALEDLSTRSFADQTDLATYINDLNSKIDELDTASPDAHRQIETDAVNGIGRILQTMSAVLTQRYQTSPSTGPSNHTSLGSPTMPS